MKYGINAISTILPADDVFDQASVAEQELQEANVARLINGNANTGVAVSEYIGVLSDVTIEKLKDHGYSVEVAKDLYGSDVKYKYIIKKAVG